MTFRTRLLIVILTVVVGAMAAALYTAQRQNSASHRAVVDELLGNWTDVFQREHEARHELAAQQAERLAGSVRLFAALEANDPEVYKIASDELRIGEFSFFRLLTTRGRLIEPPEDGRAGGSAPNLSSAELMPRLGQASRTAVDLGFVAAAGRGGTNPRVYRILAAPISNFGQPVGTLVIGQRVTDLSTPRTASGERTGLRSALWVDGRLLGGDLPDALRTVLTRELLASEGRGDGQFEAEGTRYRYQRSILNPSSAFPQAELISTFSMAAFDEQQRLLAVRIVLIGVGAAMLAGVFALALSRQLAEPIGALVRATREIRAGNYEMRLGRSPTPEIDTLSASFNEMAAGLALKERYHSVLQQVADPQVAEGLITGRVKLGGELRDVTVMFCDIRQYTALTVGRSPEVVIRLLNHHMSAMTRVVQQHRGVINQFAGDSIMALFGAPKSYGDDTARAVQCARALILERDRLNHEVEIPLRIGIGIATGPMVAGCIGAENRSDYTVVGERVNLAARLCSSAAAGEVLIDATTHERLGGAFVTEPVPPLTLKGFSAPVSAYRVCLDRMEAA